MRGEDLTGRRFGRLLVLRPERESRFSTWVCRCDCGEVKVVYGHILKRGLTKSCGCLAREMASARSRTHGKTKTKTYKVWAGMVHRCNNPKSPIFAHYGGRGISVCERWMSFENFLSDMGERPIGKEIDRINNDRGYEPSNCRWVTHTENSRNRRTTLMVEYQGITKSLKGWAEELGIDYKALHYRIRYARMPVSIAFGHKGHISNCGWGRDSNVHKTDLDKAGALFDVLDEKIGELYPTEGRSE